MTLDAHLCDAHDLGQLPILKPDTVIVEMGVFQVRYGSDEVLVPGTTALEKEGASLVGIACELRLLGPMFDSTSKHAGV